jgi:hypothetical protein
MKSAIAALATGILILWPPLGPSSAETPQEKALEPASGWVLNAEEYFERPSAAVRSR